MMPLWQYPFFATNCALPIWKLLFWQRSWSRYICATFIICMSIMTLLFTRAFYHFHLFSLSKVAPTKAKLCITLCTSILIECFVDKVLPISIISDFLKVFGLALIFWWLTKVRADRKISRLVQMVTLENGPLWFMWSFCPSFITLSSRNDFHIITSVLLKSLWISIFCKSPQPKEKALSDETRTFIRDRYRDFF